MNISVYLTNVRLRSIRSIFLLKAIAACLVAVLIFIIGVMATAYQVRQSEQQAVNLSAQKAIEKIDAILLESEQAAMLARPWLSLRCTLSARRELNRLTIDQPHLRVISLLHGDQLTCSSFGTEKPRHVDLSHYNAGRLRIRSGSIISPDVSMLILLTRFPEGTVATSIGASHITDILLMLSTTTQLSLQVAEQFIPMEDVPGVTHLRGNMTMQMVSEHYPYSISYIRMSSLPISMLLGEGKVLLAVFASLGGLGGIITWAFLFRPPSPYEQLAQAIRMGNIIPWYQPVICSQTGEITGVEVLARWRNRSGSIIPPDEFIPQAEKNGLILPLTSRLMEQTAIDLAPVISRLKQPFHIALNISAAHIAAGNVLCEDFQRLQTAFPTGSVQLVAEITERDPFEQSPRLDEILRTLQSLGIQTALDDFGTGYSNLGYLSTLAIDYIKIDRIFVSRLGEGGEQLVECIISMAETMGMEMVAEGVETTFQAEWLAKRHVHFLQGYVFSRPLPVKQFIRDVVLQKISFHNKN